MAVLHMETESVDEHGRYLLRASTSMYDLADSLSYVSRRLNYSWDGASATYFTNELNRIAAQINQHMKGLDRISRRVFEEVRSWEDADTVKGSFTDYFGNMDITLEDAKKVFAGGYLASNLRWTPLRPNSMVFTGPNWMRKLLGIKEATRVIKPTTLVKQMALIAYAENVIQGGKAALDSFFDPRYAANNRSAPAAFVDGIVKTLIMAAGTTVLVGAAFIVVKVGAIVAVPAVVGGAVIVTWTLGGIVIEKLVTTPRWERWQNSVIREEAIEKTTRGVNKVKNYFEYKAQEGVEKVRNSFEGFRQALMPA